MYSQQKPVDLQCTLFFKQENAFTAFKEWAVCQHQDSNNSPNCPEALQHTK